MIEKLTAFLGTIRVNTDVTGILPKMLKMSKFAKTQEGTGRHRNPQEDVKIYRKAPMLATCLNEKVI